MVYLHIIETTSKGQDVISKIKLHAVPRVGDEIRLSDDRFYSVRDVCWCFDEDKERANVGVVKIL